MHHLAWKIALPVVMAGGAILWHYDYHSQAIFISIGYLSGKYLDPDLDQLKITQARQNALHDFSILGYFWIGYWYAYGYLFKHRGISHVPIIGTLTRVFYLLPLMGLMWIFGSSILPNWFNQNFYAMIVSVKMMSFVIGLALSDLLHEVLDYA